MTEYGVYLKTSTAEFISIAAATGLDFVRFDLEHGSTEVADLQRLVAAAKKAGLAVGVRVPQRREVVDSVLSLGIDSVTFPGVDRAVQAKQLVRWCRPAAVVISVQIETATALENVNQIAAVDGIDVLHCGRSDLARSLGLFSRSDSHVEVDAAEDRVLVAARRAGKKGAVHWPPGNEDLARVRRLIAGGIAWVTLGADTQILRAGLVERLSQAVNPKPVDDRGFRPVAVNTTY